MRLRKKLEFQDIQVEKTIDFKKGSKKRTPAIFLNFFASNVKERVAL